MNLQGLICFIAVAQYKSFSLAAQRIFMSQPALSHQIRGLEKELGVTLFERGGSAVELTEIGKQTLPVAMEVVEGCARIRDMADRCNGVVSGRFSVGYANDRAGDVVLPALRRMEERYAGLVVQAQYLRVGPLLEALRDRRIDLAVTSELTVRQLPNIEYAVLLPRGLMAVLPEGHPLCGKKSLSFFDLSGETVILKRRESFPEEYDAFFSDCRAHDVQVGAVLEEATTEDVFTQIRLGRGIGCLGGGLLRDRVAGVVALPIEKSTQQHGIVAAWRKGGKKNAVEAFLREFEQK